MFHATRHLGRVIDISLNGIAFTSPIALSRGDLVWLRIENRHPGTSVDRAARVVRSVRTSEGLWKSMCRFREHLSIPQLQSISRLMS